MTTEKKSSRGVPEGKNLSFDEARRQERRANEVWDDSSPKMYEMLATFDEFRESFDRALAALDGFVTESQRVSDQLRKEQCEEEADRIETYRVEKWGPVNAIAFRKAATGLVDLVYSALTNGYPARVLMVEGPLLDSGRAEWGRLCDALRTVLRTGAPLSPAGEDDVIRSFAEMLISDLKTVNEHAAALEVEQVVDVASGKTRTSTGFAAQLACLCGAFGYKPGDQEKAQVAIAKAMKGGA